MITTPAAPKFGMGQIVQYFDHTNRPQSGKVRDIRASWHSWSREPHITYTVEHPTYKNKCIYIGEKGLK